MKRLLIIGASVFKIPAIKKAKEMGLYVGVADINPNAVGIPYADKYFNVSIIDEKGIYLAAKEFKADGIMTIGSDISMRSLAYAASKLGLVGISYETAIKATDKGEMMKAFEAAGVERPWYHIINSPLEAEASLNELRFPCIVKPTDNESSKGVILVNSEVDFMQAVKYSSKNGRSGNIIIEEYLQGQEVSVEIIVYNGVPHVLQITDKLTTGAPHFVETGHSQPSRIDEASQYKIKELACRAVCAVGIENGPAHVEIMLTENGPKMIELGARMGGDWITSDLLPLSTGIDMVKATIQIALGEQPDIEQKFQKGSAIRFFKQQSGTILSISGIDETECIEGVQKVIFLKGVGDNVVELENSDNRIGAVISQCNNVEAAAACCEEALKKIKITVSL